PSGALKSLPVPSKSKVLAPESFALDVNTISLPDLSIVAFWFCPPVVLVTSLGDGDTVAAITTPATTNATTAPAARIERTADLGLVIVCSCLGSPRVNRTKIRRRGL